MATLYVKNFPDELYEEVEALAAKNHRSVSAEAIVLLEQSMDEIEQRLREMDRIGERRRNAPPLPDGVDSVTLLRESRDER